LVLGLPALAQVNDVSSPAWTDTISSGAWTDMVTPPDPSPAALGDILCGPINIEVCTGDNGGLGVSTLDGNVYISSRAYITPAPHFVQMFDSDLECLDPPVRFAQDAVCTGSAWGYRDGASDGTYIYFGCEYGVGRHDADGGNSMAQISGGAPGGVGTWRGLAYDPELDGGNGGFWTASFSTPLVSTTMSGALIDAYPNACGWSIYGIALDPCTGNLWVNSIPNIGDICEVSREGECTGVCFTPPPRTSQGGLEGIFDGVCSSGHFWDMVGLGQHTPDIITGYEGYPESCPGKTGCEYEVKKDSKMKKGCTLCYKKGDKIMSKQPCEKVKDCDRKIKEKTYDCLEGEIGFCKKLKAKRSACIE